MSNNHQLAPPDNIYVGNTRYVLAVEDNQVLTQKYKNLHEAVLQYVKSSIDQMEYQKLQNEGNNLVIHAAICEGYLAAMLDVQDEIKQLEEGYDLQNY